MRDFPIENIWTILLRNRPHDLVKDGERMIRTVGVIGAGIMGEGIAHDLANHGFRAVVVDSSASKRETCLSRIYTNARLYRLAGVRTEPTAMKRIQVEGDLGALADADFVIETVTESLIAKHEVLRAVDRICRPEVVFASNTSAIPIRQLAAATERADRVLGMHFMNPAPLQSCIEIARNIETSEVSVDTAIDLSASLGKSCIVVADSPGFVSNRIMMLAINEAAALVAEKVASAEEVDRVFIQCMHHKMGPLATADLIGLDTVLLTLRVLSKEINPVKYVPADLLRELVAAGKLGRKTGEGFYWYE